jgi:hypothetical protein
VCLRKRKLIRIEVHRLDRDTRHTSVATTNAVAALWSTVTDNGGLRSDERA